MIMLETKNKIKLSYVSIIIPVLNGERHIGNCLKSIFNVNYPKEYYEVILVDNGSTDRTLEIAMKYNVKILSILNVTIAAVRNYGAKNAKGEILAFIDSDCLPTKDWLRNAINVLADNSSIGIVGSKYPLSKGAGRMERAWHLVYNSNPNYIGPTRWLSGGNLIARRKCFDAVGGFNEFLVTNEDVDFCSRAKKVGFVVWSDVSISVIHLGNPRNFFQVFRKEYWYGKNILGVFLRNLHSANQLGIVLFSIFFLLVELQLVVAIAIRSSRLAAFALCSLFFVCIILTAKHVITSRKYSLCVHVFLLYLAFGLARGLSLINIKSLIKK